MEIDCRGEPDVDELIDAVEELCTHGANDEALLAASFALAGVEAAAPDDDRLMGRAHGALAGAQLCCGELGEAVRHANAALERLERVQPHGRPLAVALHTRATAHLEMGELEMAMPLLERSVGILESCGQVARADYCSVLVTIAEVSLEVGESEAAAGLFGRVLGEIGVQEPGSDGHARWLNAMTAKAFMGLGAASVQRGDADGAGDYLGRVGAFLEAAYGRGHPARIDGLVRVAELYGVLGDEGAARAAEAELDAARAELRDGEVEPDDEEEPDDEAEPDGRADTDLDA